MLPAGASSLMDRADWSTAPYHCWRGSSGRSITPLTPHSRMWRHKGLMMAEGGKQYIKCGPSAVGRNACMNTLSPAAPWASPPCSSARKHGSLWFKLLAQASIVKEREYY